MRKTYGAGDFRSSECIKLLKEADIVVTNPPFSLLREFIAQLVEYKKKFLILGNVNAIHYKKIFPLFKNNKIWLGISIHSGDRKFRLKSYVDPSEFDENGDEYVKVSGVRWFTNLKITKRNKPLMLEGSYYTPEKYPKYDNYDAINVDKVADIPCDYPGVMGVPTSFMDKYCPEQFRIIGLDRYTVPKKDLIGGCLAINSKLKYARILIKNNHPQKSKERKKVNKKETVLLKVYKAGDFRSSECIELLKEADIVVTNPPFSLLREFIAQLVEYNKKFLIIGNTNAMGYKEIFPLFKDNKIWLGVTTRPDFPHKDLRSIGMWFRAPDYYELENSTSCKIENGKKYIFITNARWFTNLKTKYKQKPLDMLEVYYTPEKYPKYDNYDAINVDKVADIPCDYPGVMGVPLTFMDKYCPEQFSIEGITGRGNNVNFKTKIYTKEDAENYGDLNRGPTLVKNREKKNVYTRIFIKNKHPQKSEEREEVNKIFNTPKGFLSVITTALYRKVA